MSDHRRAILLGRLYKVPTMANLIYTFDKPETLDDRIDDFEFHCDAKGNITEEQKRGMFMETLDKPTKRSLKEWLAPTLTPRTATYAQIIAKLKEKIQPSINKFVAWNEFRQRKQLEGESGAAFHAELKRLADPCGFEGVGSKLVLFQFVNGLQNKQVQQSLLARHEELTLTDALKIVSASEESAKSSRAVRSEEVEEVHRAESRSSRSFKKDLQSRLICYRCGEADHTARTCPKPWRNFRCTKCGKRQHLAKACRLRQGTQRDSSNRQGTSDDSSSNARQTNHVADYDETLGDDDDSEGLYVIRPRETPPESDEVIMRPVMGTVVVNGKSLQFEIDSGASRTIISYPTYTRIFTDYLPPLYDSGVELVTWGEGSALRTAGRFFADVQFKGVTKYLPVMVGEGPGPNLLGRNWFIPFGLRVEGAYRLMEPMLAVPELSELLQLPAVTGEGTGCYRGPPLHLDLDPSVRPVYQLARRVPFALTTKMEEAIDENVQKGHWVPMRYAGKWASALVPVPKSNGKLRLCADYSATINPALPVDSYRTCTTEEIFSKLSGGKWYAAIDLEDAYQQCPVDLETSRVLAVNTVRGLFRVVRMPFGISLAPSVFQRVIDGLFGGLQGTVAYQDNLYVTAETASQLRQRVYNLLRILGDAGLKVNTKKCVWEAKSIEVLGFRLDASGRRPLPQRVDAIKKAPAPTSKRELQSLLGFINFYDCFLRNKATTFEPLYRLLDAGTPWNWTAAHEKALQTVKNQISSEDVLAHYSPDSELLLTCDASAVGVGAVLATVLTTGKHTKRGAPICFASRTLSNTERRYSQLDKEALAIKFGLTKFHQYLSGRQFTIVTDHRPLLGIFKPGKPIPAHLSPRLLRYALLLASMNYKLVYRPGSAIGHADYLSRHPVETSPDSQDPDPAGVYLLEARDLPGLSSQDVARATANDSILSHVLKWTINGWPPSVLAEFSVYYRKRDEITVLKDCLLYRDRVIIPPSLQDSVLQLVHGTHLGESYSKATARSIVWWPGCDTDVVNAVKTCESCQNTARAPAKKIVSPWPKADSAWERVHLDYFFLDGHNFLLAVDSYSGWAVVRLVSNLSTAVLITHVRYMLADYGKPLVFVSDNGAQFASQEFREFLKTNGINHLFSPPWHPSSNGLAERTVGSFKRFFLRLQAGDIHARVARTLWAMRTAPSSVGGRTPAEAMGRAFRTHLTQLHPAQQPTKTSTSSPLARHPGEMVWMLRHTLRGTEWVPGVITASNGARCFEVRLDSGQVMKNVSGDHLRLRFGEEQQYDTSLNSNLDESFDSQRRTATPVRPAGTKQDVVADPQVYPELDTTTSVSTSTASAADVPPSTDTRHNRPDSPDAVIHGGPHCSEPPREDLDIPHTTMETAPIQQTPPSLTQVTNYDIDLVSNNRCNEQVSPVVAVPVDNAVQQSVNPDGNEGNPGPAVCLTRGNPPDTTQDTHESCADSDPTIVSEPPTEPFYGFPSEDNHLASSTPRRPANPPVRPPPRLSSGNCGRGRARPRTGLSPLPPGQMADLRPSRGRGRRSLDSSAGHIVTRSGRRVNPTRRFDDS